MSEQGLCPFISSSNAAAAIDFYKKAFGAEETMRNVSPGDNRIMHAHLRILGGDFKLADDFSDKMGGKPETPEALGGCPVTFHLQVKDADSIWASALAAGATVTMPLKDQFWGDRYGQLLDPFGYKWSIGQTIKTLSTDEVLEGAKAANF